MFVSRLAGLDCPRRDHVAAPRRGGRRSLRRGALGSVFLALAFTAGVAVAADNSSFVSYSGVPTRMEPGDTAIVTVTMLNNGSTTWERTVTTCSLPPGAR